MDAIRTQNPRWSTPRHLRVEYSKHRFRSNLYAIYKQHPLSSPPPGGLLKGTSLTKKNPFNNSPKHHRRSSPPKHLYKKSATLPSTYRIPRRKTPNEEGKKERKEKKSKEKKRKAKKRKEKQRKEKKRKEKKKNSQTVACGCPGGNNGNTLTSATLNPLVPKNPAPYIHHSHGIVRPSHLTRTSGMINRIRTPFHNLPNLRIRLDG